MVRFLVILVSLSALVVGLSFILSRFTITLTISPTSSTQTSPAESTIQNKEAATTPAAKPVGKRIDSHHTKG